jgi:hypothetical protein
MYLTKTIAITILTIINIVILSLFYYNNWRYIAVSMMTPPI